MNLLGNTRQVVLSCTEYEEESKSERSRSSAEDDDRVSSRDLTAAEEMKYNPVGAELARSTPEGTPRENQRPAQIDYGHGPASIIAESETSDYASAKANA